MTERTEAATGRAPRRLTAAFFMSLDGVVDAPQEWNGPYADAELGRAVGGMLAATETLLMGRRTYEEWAAHWPHVHGDGGLADRINAAEKLVVSTTLRTLDWEHARVLAGDPIEAVRAVKARPGGAIAMNGSGTLARALLEAGLVDELALLVLPVLVGRGKHLFEGGTGPAGLELVERVPFASGVLALTYRPAAERAGEPSLVGGGAPRTGEG